MLFLEHFWINFSIIFRQLFGGFGGFFLLFLVVFGGLWLFLAGFWWILVDFGGFLLGFGVFF